MTVRRSDRFPNAQGGVTQKSIRQWFKDLRKNLKYYKLEDILEDPSRVFNSDEMNIQLNPKKGNVISIQRWENVYETSPDPDKSNLTFLGTFGANGEIACPTIVFPYVRLPSDIIRLMPKDFCAAISESGCVTAPVFYDFICNTFNDWLVKNQIKKPVILFLDGRTAHMTMQLSMKSQELGIFLYLLPPKTRRLLFPADVGVFKPIKTEFKQLVHDYNSTKEVKRKNIGQFLEECLSLITKESIINAFKTTGLCPYNPDIVPYSKCVKTEVIPDNKANTSTSSNKIMFSEDSYDLALNIIRSEIGEDALNDCISNNDEINELSQLIKNIHEKSKKLY